MANNFSLHFLEFRDVPQDWDKANNFLNWYFQQLTNVVNSKAIGIYSSQEIPAGKQLYVSAKPKTMLRRTFVFGALPNNTTKSIPHNIDTAQGFQVFNVYLAANDPINGSYFCLQYYSLDATASIRLVLDNTNINVITTQDYSPYTDCYVVVEYLRGSI